jgi:hypothetical protein
MGKSNNTLWTLTPGGTIPTEDDFLLQERRIIQTHQSPEKVQNFLRSIPYNRELGGETCYSFRRALKENRVHCLEGALVAAVILEQHGYPPILVSIESQDKLDHVLLLFRRNDRYGSVARSRDIGLHGRKPVFRTVRDLVMSYFEPYIDKTARVTGYAVASLYELGNYDWRLSMRNVLKVERYLQDIPHKQVRSSEARYERARRRYLEFHREHPDRSPDYFANRSLWLS